MIRLQDIQSLLRLMIRQVVNEGDTVVDGTAGNGRDTLFLSQLVGPSGEVFAFDIQEAALENTRRLLHKENACAPVKLLHADHAQVVDLVAKPIKAAMFNLGYLPGSDHKVVTTPESTVKAVLGCCNLLQAGGIISITAYRGHPGGYEEAEQLLQSLQTLPKEFTVLCGQYVNLERTVPLWILVQRK